MNIFAECGIDRKRKSKIQRPPHPKEVDPEPERVKRTLEKHLRCRWCVWRK